MISIIYFQIKKGVLNMSIAASVTLTGLTVSQATAIIQEAQKKNSAVSFTGFEAFTGNDRKTVVSKLL